MIRTEVQLHLTLSTEVNKISNYVQKTCIVYSLLHILHLNSANVCETLGIMQQYISNRSKQLHEDSHQLRV